MFIVHVHVENILLWYSLIWFDRWLISRLLVRCFCSLQTNGNVSQGWLHSAHSVHFYNSWEPTKWSETSVIIRNRSTHYFHKLLVLDLKYGWEYFTDGNSFTLGAEHTCPDGCMFASLNIWSTGNIIMVSFCIHCKKVKPPSCNSESHLLWGLAFLPT